MQTAQLSAVDAIDTLDNMLGKLNSIRAHMSDEAEQITEEWAMLGVAGGQRADHAAQLLKRLRPHLNELQSFAQIVTEQLNQVIAKPFGN